MSTLFASQNGSLEVAPHDGLHHYNTSALPGGYHARHVDPNERLQTSPEQRRQFLNLKFRKTTFYWSLAFPVSPNPSHCCSCGRRLYGCPTTTPNHINRHPNVLEPKLWTNKRLLHPL